MNLNKYNNIAREVQSTITKKGKRESLNKFKNKMFKHTAKQR